MIPNLNQIIGGYSPFEILIELAVIWACVYFIFRFLRGTRGAGVIKGFAVVLVLLTLAMRVIGDAVGAFSRLTFIYDRFLGIIAILLIVVFQPELRQAMIRVGHARFIRGPRGRAGPIVDAVGEAVEFLSKSQFGAVIAIQRSVGLRGLIDGGVRLDAELSARLLEAIFWPNSPLHDLGVIIHNGRIMAASVQFPLSEQGLLPHELGSRHRAAVGLTFDSDALVVIVSEETGAISIAEHGRLERDIPREHFRDALAVHLAAAPSRVAPGRDKDDSDRRPKPPTPLPPPPGSGPAQTEPRSARPVSQVRSS